MIYHINWASEALTTFEQNLIYVEKNWGLRAVNDFLDRVEDILEKISVNPKIFPFYNQKKEIHKCVVTPQISVYYKTEASLIILLTFWNNYQNPKKLLIT